MNNEGLFIGGTINIVISSILILIGIFGNISGLCIIGYIFFFLSGIGATIGLINLKEEEYDG